jgi:hypothetical protein
MAGAKDAPRSQDGGVETFFLDSSFALDAHLGIGLHYRSVMSNADVQNVKLRQRQRPPPPGDPGRLGVCLATTGPGAVHLMNGLYDAALDGAPVLAITGTTFHDL